MNQVAVWNGRLFYVDSVSGRYIKNHPSLFGVPAGTIHIPMGTMVPNLITILLYIKARKLQIFLKEIVFADYKKQLRIAINTGLRKRDNTTERAEIVITDYEPCFLFLKGEK